MPSRLTGSRCPQQVHSGPLGGTLPPPGPRQVPHRLISSRCPQQVPSGPLSRALPQPGPRQVPHRPTGSRRPQADPRVVPLTVPSRELPPSCPLSVPQTPQRVAEVVPPVVAAAAPLTQCPQVPRRRTPRTHRYHGLLTRLPSVLLNLWSSPPSNKPTSHVYVP